MNSYADGEFTILAQGEFFSFDYENQELPGKEYIDSLNDVSVFSERLKDIIKNRGFQANGQDTNEIAKYILEQCERENIIISRQNIVNWLTGGMPSSGTSGRENVYKLCFALGMNERQTGEFFLKAYLERPFNYKNISESVYYFCMKNGKKYSDACRLIDLIKSLPVKNGNNEEINTEYIRVNIDKIRDEKQFIKYFSENNACFSVQNQSACKTIEKMLDECMDLAEKEYQITNAHAEPITVKSIDELLDVIYGYSARATEGFEEKNGKLIPKNVYHETISESAFPKLIKRNFPQRQQFENILKGKASFDVIRKALIMLNFYHFFATAIVNKCNYEEGLFDEFTDEMNEILAHCGYVQLYWRNPYDWMFGYCACAINPLAELRDLIYEYYQGNEEIFND